MIVLNFCIYPLTQFLLDRWPHQRLWASGKYKCPLPTFPFTALTDRHLNNPCFFFCFFFLKSWSSSLCRILSWPDLEKKMASYLRSSFKSWPSSKRASLKIALDRADVARRVLFAPAAVVIGLVPVGSAASREGEGETAYLPGEAHFICLSGFPPCRPTTVWLGTYWPWLIFPDLLKQGGKNSKNARRELIWSIKYE